MALESSSIATMSAPLAIGHRRLVLAAGIAALAGGVLAIVLNAVVMFAPAAGTPGLVAYPQTVSDYRAGQVVFAATQLLMGFGLFAMIRSRIARIGTIGRVGGWLALVGWAITVPGELIIGVVANQPMDSDAAGVATGIYGVAVMVADIGLILFGVGVLRSPAWRHTWGALPLALGIVQLFFVTPVLLVIGFIGIPAFIALVVQDLLVALIGTVLIRRLRS